MLLLLLLLLHVAAVPVSVWLNASLFGPGPLAGLVSVRFAAFYLIFGSSSSHSSHFSRPQNHPFWRSSRLCRVDKPNLSKQNTFAQLQRQTQKTKCKSEGKLSTVQWNDSIITCGTETAAALDR